MALTADERALVKSLIAKRLTGVKLVQDEWQRLYERQEVARAWWRLWEKKVLPTIPPQPPPTPEEVAQQKIEWEATKTKFRQNWTHWFGVPTGRVENGQPHEPAPAPAAS